MRTDCPLLTCQVSTTAEKTTIRIAHRVYVRTRAPFSANPLISSSALRRMTLISSPVFDSDMRRQHYKRFKTVKPSQNMIDLLRTFALAAGQMLASSIIQNTAKLVTHASVACTFEKRGFLNPAVKCQPISNGILRTTASVIGDMPDGAHI